MTSDNLSDKELQEMIRLVGNNLDLDESTETTHRPSFAGNPMVDSSAEIINNEIILHWNENADSEEIHLESLFPVKLVVNNSSPSLKVSLTRRDQVSWKIEDPIIKIKVTSDGMKAYLHVIKTAAYKWDLKDTKKSNPLMIEGVENKNQIVQSLTSSEIISQMKREGIEKDINLPDIVQESEQPTFAPIIVAEGIQVVPSQDAKLEVFFAEREESLFQDINGKIDFKNHRSIPQSNRGVLLAKKEPSVIGEHGRNVYNEIVMTPPPKDIPVQAGKHVYMSPKHEFFALKSGRPKITEGFVKRIEISTEYVIHSDVGLETGNIIFSGDVVVYGNVLEGMIIEAHGNVYVFGNVYQSTITATGSIYIYGNAIGSFLYSGYFGVVFNRMYTLTKKLAEHLKLLTAAVNQIFKEIQQKGKTIKTGLIVHELMQTKFSVLPALFKDTLATLSNVRKLENAELIELKELLIQFDVPTVHLALESLDPLLEMKRLANKTYEDIEQMQESHVTIEFAQSSESTIKSNGDIIISKEGTVQSQLFAKNRIVYKHPDAVCRGGNIEAGGLIHLMSVGGISGGEAIITTQKKISASKIYMAKLYIGRNMEYIQEPIKDVTAYLEKGKLILKGEPI